MKRIFEALGRMVRAYSLDWDSVKFKKSIVKKDFISKIGNIILVESEQPASNQLAHTIFLPALSKHIGGAELICYSIGASSFLSKTKKYIRHRFSVTSKIALNTKLLIPSNENIDFISIEEIRSLFQGIKSPEDLEKFTYSGILIGDLIYDTYLRRTDFPTIDLKDKTLLSVFSEAINLVIYWQNYFELNNVSAVCLSHCVYISAIPGRVGILYGAEVFQVTAESIYRVTKEFPFAYTDFKNYRNVFRNLSESEQNNGLQKAKERLERRFSGEVGVDMFYSTKSAYAKSSKSDVLAKTNKFKVLVAVHDFFDSPHSYGENFYPDFLIWLNSLNSLSKRVDYDWYVKTHADIRGVGERVIEQFVAASNNFKLVSSDTSHHDLISEGIDCVLTVYGTIGMEYPALGKLAINASLNNPHVAYDFSITPDNRKNYEDLILKLPQIKVLIDKTEIYEYYFMRNIYNIQNWIFADSGKFQIEIGGYNNSVSSKCFSYFQNTQNRRDRETYEIMLGAFLSSNDLRLNRAHFKHIFPPILND
jgi:hypothetical protein